MDGWVRGDNWGHQVEPQKWPPAPPALPRRSSRLQCLPTFQPLAERAWACADKKSFREIVTHADDTWAWWYSRRLGYTDSDVIASQEFLKPVATFLQGDLPKAAKEWWGHEPTSEDGQRLREIRGGKTSVVQDDRWDDAIKLAAAVQV